MKVMVIGATGTIGKALVTTLGGRHEVIRVSRKLGIKVDIEDSRSIKQLFENIKPIDAVVSCAGRAAFRPLAQLNDDDFQLSLRSKLMGQVNLVRIGMNHVRDSGSFTLTGGVLAHEPMAYVAAIEGNYNGQTLDARKFV